MRVGDISRSRRQSCVVLFDLIWAAASGPLALLLRNPDIFHSSLSIEAGLYSIVSFVFCLASFKFFRISTTMSRFFSAPDAVEVLSASAAGIAMGSLATFALVRLDGIPRSAPLIHFLVLMVGLVAGRTLSRLKFERASVRHQISGREQRIIIVGANKAAFFYMRLLREFSFGGEIVVALVDDGLRHIGRRIHGRQIVGRPQDLGRIIREFQVHGIEVSKIVLAVALDRLSPAAQVEVRRVEHELAVAVESLPELAGVRQRRLAAPSLPTSIHSQPVAPYFKFKRILDFVVALVLLVLLSPAALVVGLLVLMDVGMPILFWQRRLGLRGTGILVYKFRTLQSPFAPDGQHLSQSERLSTLGRGLRFSRLDEIPQLLSVLSGEMSIIGPRPLLPADQPDDVGVRLSVAPGLTGWAQVNGGKLLTPAEKNALDNWYIRNASLWLDIQIFLRTAAMMLFGERRNQLAIDVAFGRSFTTSPFTKDAETPVGTTVA